MFCQIATLLQDVSSLNKHSHNFDQNNIHIIIIIQGIVLRGVIEIKANNSKFGGGYMHLFGPSLAI